MRILIKLAVLAGLVFAAKWLYDNYVAESRGSIGYDTATGTDPDAKYREPGYPDKSFGQAVSQDQALADRLIEATDGDADEAAIRFGDLSAGAPALERQESE